VVRKWVYKAGIIVVVKNYPLNFDWCSTASTAGRDREKYGVNECVSGAVPIA
jgi:hypothetical protein